MQVVPELSWQWRPDAAISACDSTQRCTALALQYSEIPVVRVRPNESPYADSKRSAEELRPETESRDIELDGHTDRISCLRFHAFHDTTDLLLASASSDRIIVWHLDDELHATQKLIVDKPLDEPTCLAFDHTGTLLAIACDREVEVRIIHSGELLVTLEGHLGKVTMCEFHPLRQHLLFTCSEDRTFKIWDLAAKSLLFQSAVLSAFPILSLALNPSTGDASVGFGDGTVKIFTILDAFAREHATLNIDSFMRRLTRKKMREEEVHAIARESPNVVSSLPPWARSERAHETAQIQALIAPENPLRTSYSDVSERRRSVVLPGDDSHVAELAYPVLGMRYLCVDNPRTDCDDRSPASTFNAHGVQELLPREQFLVLATPSTLLAVNAFSLEIRVLLDLQSPLHGSGLDAIAVARELSFHTPDGSDVLYCGVVSAFLPCFTMVCTSIAHDRSRPRTPATTINNNSSSSSTSNQASETTDERLSVIATGPPPPGSVLNLPPLSVAKPLTAKPGSSIPDKPITFRTRIKSSGYGASSTAHFPSKQQQRAAKKPSPPKPTAVEAYLKEYPVECGLLQHFQPKHALPPKTLHHGAIHHVEYSNDAKLLATGGRDRLAILTKLPFSKHQGDGAVLAGHDHAVRSVHWSHSNRLLLTTSSDKTAKLWLADSDVASLTLEAASSSTTAKVKPDMVDALFFYMDKFVLSASGNVVRLHQFEIDELFARTQSSKGKQQPKSNSASILTETVDRSRLHRAAQWRFADMQNVTSLACVNGSFLSTAVLLAGSDRSLRIVDAAAGRTARVIRDAHARPALALALPRASCFVSHPSNFYDLLLSSAPTANAVHLWDIRADNCVMRFGEHVNRVHQIGAAFSPCMRYVATGSEDRLAYVYDIRSGRCLAKLGGHSDVVTSVAFSPLHPQLVTASYDGTLRFYSDHL